MGLSREDRRRLRAHCGEVNEDDAVDPREFFKPPRRTKHDRKALQLCSQVAQTLSLVLSGECDDEVLQSLRVEAVEPAPNASQLAVTVRSDPRFSSAEARRRLSAAAGRLRAEVAASITRRRTPQLVFHVVDVAGAEGLLTTE